MLGRALAKVEPHTTTTEKTANKTSNSVSTNQSAGNPKTFPIVENRGYANEQPNAMVINTIELISVIFFHAPLRD